MIRMKSRVARCERWRKVQTNDGKLQMAAPQRWTSNIPQTEKKQPLTLTFFPSAAWLKCRKSEAKLTTRSGRERKQVDTRIPKRTWSAVQSHKQRCYCFWLQRDSWPLPIPSVLPLSLISCLVSTCNYPSSSFHLVSILCFMFGCFPVSLLETSTEPGPWKQHWSSPNYSLQPEVEWVKKLTTVHLTTCKDTEQQLLCRCSLTSKSGRSFTSNVKPDLFKSDLSHFHTWRLPRICAGRSPWKQWSEVEPGLRS